MALTYTAIATVTVGSGGASNIEFTSIPGTYTDLLVLLSARNDQTGATFGSAYMQFNNNTANYSGRTLYGFGSGFGSLSTTSNDSLWSYISSSSATASTFSNSIYYIPNYTSSNNKSVSIDGVSEHNGTDGRQNFTAGLWSNSAAITSIKLLALRDTGAAANFVQYSTATLYGIKNTV